MVAPLTTTAVARVDPLERPGASSLTAYDVQRIQSGAIAAYTGSMEKAAVIGALQLYLDFINIFLFLLRLLGGRS